MSSPNVRIFYKKILKCRNVWLILLISVCIIVLTYFGSILVVGINNGFEMFQQEDFVEFPEYNNSDIRTKWEFAITKNYPKSLLVAYKPAGPVTAEFSSAPGEMGAQVEIPPQLKRSRDEMYKIQNFDLLASNMVSMKRSLPDVRSPECIRKAYPKRLPKASVIVIFHDEPWSTLTRTLWSIVNRSPRQLLEEIILVDDLSTAKELKNPLADYVKVIPATIKIIRTEKRQGLIRARLIGARRALGPVLVFLDAHMECTAGWLEPLLTRIASDRSVVAVPALDVISSDNLGYVPQTPAINGLHWSLVFDWMKVPEREWKRVNHDPTAPLRTPIIVGCALAVDKEFFNEIGSFDEGMDIWGGENVEIAFRVWQCGGLLEVIPCSRIGHLFRVSTYSFGSDKNRIIDHNNMRAVEVWMDDYKQLFYAAAPQAKLVDPGSLTARKLLREKLKCKSFDWFLKNIYPESNFERFRFAGMLRHGGDCLDYFDGKRAHAVRCHHNGGNQAFILNYRNQIVYSGEECLCEKIDDTKEKIVGFCPCSANDKKLKWKWDEGHKYIVHDGSGLCLSTRRNSIVSLQACNTSDESVHWEWQFPTVVREEMSTAEKTTAAAYHTN